LRALAGHGPGEPLSPAVADEVGQETSVILAEADAAARAALAAFTGSGRRAVAGFLAARLTRLAAAAREATDAAKESDAGMLHRTLRRFESLTLAMWAVQLGIPGPATTACPPAAPCASGSGPGPGRAPRR
jgi:hypothetical protein